MMVSRDPVMVSRKLQNEHRSESDDPTRSLWMGWEGPHRFRPPFGTPIQTPAAAKRAMGGSLTIRNKNPKYVKYIEFFPSK